MYIPEHFAATDNGVMHALIQSSPLGTWVMQEDGELEVNHIPFLIDTARGEHGTLMGHIARSNPVWQDRSPERACVVVFHGPQAYITPNWYPGKEQHGRVVPTWNYAVVHAHGVARFIDDRGWLLRHVEESSTAREAGQAHPWKVADAPAEYIEKLLGAIIGVEICVTRLVGKWKASQNQPLAEKQGVVEGLLAQRDTASRGMAAIVAERMTVKHRS